MRCFALPLPPPHCVQVRAALTLDATNAPPLEEAPRALHRACCGVEAALRSVREASAHADKVSLGAKEKVDGTAAKAADSMDAVRDAAREAADQTSVRCAICRCLWFVGPF